MKKNLVITDLTRMHRGRVCIAGCDSQHKCIRPILRSGIPESYLIQDGKPVIYPSALVEFELLEPLPQPPHTEDQRYDASSPRFIHRVKDWEAILRWSLFESVSAIFEQPVHSDFGYYVMDGQGPRSVGTVQPAVIVKILYEPGEEGSWSYRLLFYDRKDDLYRLKITDMTWNYYCNSLRDENPDPSKIASRLTDTLKSSKLYLRVGLARGWNRFPDRCYLQVNGIYTFPDYLKGKTFADFINKN